MRLWPGTLAGRISLLLAGALVLAFGLAVAVLALQQRDFDRRLGADREAERVLALVPVLEAASPTARDRIARDASTRFLSVSVDPEPAVRRSAPDRRARFVANRLSAALDGRVVAVGLRDGAPGAAPRPEPLSLSVRLMTEGAPLWLNVTSQRVSQFSRWTAPVAILTAFAVALALVLVLSLLMARHLTRPLAALATAARAAGQGDRSARATETGVTEMRDAARAFNDMQARIARFDAERTRVLGAVGHDLRTPMTSLRLRAEMVEDPDLRDPMIRTLDEMAVMADGLVSYARTGAEAEAATPLDLATLLADLCAERGAVWSGGDPITLTGRPVALRRIFGNLIDNALRYGGSAEVAAHTEGGQAVVTICDTGPGIPPERLAAMFEPFTRGESSRDVAGGGAGLGLSIARSLIVAQGGEIALANAPEGGLIAEVRLPLG